MARPRNTGGARANTVAPVPATRLDSSLPKSKQGETWYTVPKGEQEKLAVLAQDAVRSQRATAYEQGRLGMWREHMQYYNDDNGFWFQYGQNPLAGAVERVSRNVCRSVVDAAQAMICASQPKPFVQTFDGSWSSQQKAEGLNRWLRGLFVGNKVHRLAEDVTKDAMIGDSGFFRVTEVPYVDEKDREKVRKALKNDEKLPEYTIKRRVGFERARPWDVVIPPAEVFRGWHQWRLLYEVKHWDRMSAITLWCLNRSDEQIKAQNGSPREDLRKALETAAAWDGENAVWIDEMGTDLIEAYELWKGPSFDGAADGRHVLVINNAVVFDVPWWHFALPFVGIVWRTDPLAVLGRGIVDGVKGKQQTISANIRAVNKNLRLLAAPKWAYEAGSITPAHLADNRSGTQVKVKPGMKYPQALSMTPVNQEQFFWIKSEIEAAYEDEGISQAVAEATKPPDVESGLAIRRVVEVGKRRLALQQGAFDEMFVDLTYAAVDRAVDILDDEGSYPIKAYGSLDGDRTIVDLKDVNLSRDVVTFQVMPSNALSDVPGERVADIQAYQQIGLLKDPRALAQLLGGIPDFQAELDLLRAPKDAIQKQLEDVLAGKQAALDENMDPVLARQIALATWNFLAKFNDTETERARISDYMTSITNVEQRMPSETPAPPMPPAGAAPPPAGPPMAPPPGLAPPPMQPGIQ